MGRLLLVFILLPMADLFLLLKLGSYIGFWPTVGIVVLTGITGFWLAKNQGLYIFRRIQQELALGHLPGTELLEGAIILAGAMLLLTPGFITDLCGVLLLLPGTRQIFRELLKVKLRHMVDKGSVRFIYRGH